MEVFMGQLRMVYVADEKKTLPDLEIAPGFALRTFGKDELDEYSALRVSAGFDAWDAATFERETLSLLPGCHLVITEIATGRFAASASAELPVPEEFHGFGLLGWVMCHPDFRGKRLGYAVCLAVMRILYSYGYRSFILSTDDCRIPAVKTYLNLGWQPWLTEPDMEERWRNLTDVFHCSYESFRPLPGTFAPPKKVTLHPFD
jgi:mycothiol synthase